MLEHWPSGKDQPDRQSASICVGGPEHVAALRTGSTDAAVAYRGGMTPQLYHEPWMCADYLPHELDAVVRFIVYHVQGNMLRVVGVQTCGAVTLVRHAYVRTAMRGKGIGSYLIGILKVVIERPMLVGCLQAMTWAMAFYQKARLYLVCNEERDRLRAVHWILSPDHVRHPLVRADTRWLQSRQVYPRAAQSSQRGGVSGSFVPMWCWCSD